MKPEEIPDDDKSLKNKYFRRFLWNDWRHMNWKVNGLLAGYVVAAGLLVTILAIVCQLALGG